MSNGKQGGNESNPDPSAKGSTANPKANKGSSEANAADQKPKQDPSLALRRAELQWGKLMQEATVSYQSGMASAAATYQQAMAEISRELWDKELAAINEANGSGGTDMEAAQVIQKQRAAIEESRSEAYRRAAAAGWKYTEDSQNTWFDFLGKQKEAHRQYLQAVESLHAPSPFRAPSIFAVAADEGVDPTRSIMPAAWPAWSWG